MKTASLLTLTAAMFGVGTSFAFGAEKAPQMLCHDVYFTLKDDSPKATETLVAGCKKFLSEHPGIVWFAAGALVKEHDREVNDRDFHVALHIVFKDKASHDKYQEADAHHKFIEEFQENWESVRVFDSWLTSTAHGEDESDKAASKPAKQRKLPDPAAHFAGMIEGTVVAQTDRGVVVNVGKVLKIWRNSKAKAPEALVGNEVHVVVKTEDRYGQLARKFVQSLKDGERVELDVAHREGEVLVLLELTDEQRRRVAD